MVLGRLVALLCSREVSPGKYDIPGRVGIFQCIVGTLGIVEGGFLVGTLALDGGDCSQSIRCLLNGSDNDLVVLADCGIQVRCRAAPFARRLP